MAYQYDPVAAHEYYMKHRKLKGRKRSTKGFSEKQKQQFKEAKEYLGAQKKDKNDDSRARIEERKKAMLEHIREAKQRQKEIVTQRTADEIARIREQFKKLSPEEKKEQREKIKGVISQLRESAKQQKQAITEKAKNKSAGVREKASADKKKAVAKNKADYENAVDKVYNSLKKSK